MNSSTAFDKTNSEDEETIALRALQHFQEHPHAIGLDNVKESLRNIIQLMWELKGYSTGYAFQILLYGEHSSLAADGPAIDSDKKKKMERELWDYLLKFEESMFQSFKQVYQYVNKHIIQIKQNLAEEIAEIDEQIEAKASTSMEAQAMKASSNKRKKLVKFEKHVEAQHEELREAETTREIIEIQKTVIEDVEDFHKGKFNPNKDRSNPLYPLSEILPLVQAQNDDVYDQEFHQTSSSEKSDRGKTSGDDTKGSGGSGDSSTTDSGGKDDDTKPPPLVIDF